MITKIMTLKITVSAVATKPCESIACFTRVIKHRIPLTISLANPSLHLVCIEALIHQIAGWNWFELSIHLIAHR